MELMGPAPLGAQAAIAAQTPARRIADVPKVEASQGSGSAGLDAHQHPDQDKSAASARDLVKLREEAGQGTRPAGPTPSFQVSILEVQSDLKQAIARMETARSQSRDAAAVSEKAAQTARSAAEDESNAQAELDAARDTQSRGDKVAASETDEQIGTSRAEVSSPEKAPEAADPSALPAGPL